MAAANSFWLLAKVVASERPVMRNCLMRISVASPRMSFTATTDGSQFVATSFTDRRMPDSMVRASRPWPAQINAKAAKATARDVLIDTWRRMIENSAGGS